MLSTQLLFSNKCHPCLPWPTTAAPPMPVPHPPKKLQLSCLGVCHLSIVCCCQFRQELLKAELLNVRHCRLAPSFLRIFDVPTPASDSWSFSMGLLPAGRGQGTDPCLTLLKAILAVFSTQHDDSNTRVRDEGAVYARWH